MAGIQIDGVNNKIDFDDDADTSISSATDDTLVVEVGGTNIATVTATSFTINDAVTINVDDTDNALKVVSTEAGNTRAPVLNFHRNSPSPADNDYLGYHKFTGENDASEETIYIQEYFQAKDVRSVSEVTVRGKKAIALHVGPIGQKVILGMRRAIREYALMGNNIVVDYISYEDNWRQDLLDVLQNIPLILVKVNLPLEVLEKREQQRSTSPVGHARSHYFQVHQNWKYDLDRFYRG